MNGRAAAAVVGLASTGAVAVWLFAQAYLSMRSGAPVIDVSAQAARALLLVLALAAALSAPHFAVALPRMSALVPSLAVPLVALPLVTLLWQTGVSGPALLAGTFGVMLASVVLVALTRAVVTVMSRFPSYPAVAAVQVCGLAAAWHFHDGFMARLGL